MDNLKTFLMIIVLILLWFPVWFVGSVWYFFDASYAREDWDRNDFVDEVGEWVAERIGRDG